jgi:8-oxo-dGTP diphosphatase
MLVLHRAPDGVAHVLLQQRAWWCSGAGTWCMFGGGRNRGEGALTAALRETNEECTLDTGALRILGLVNDDHGGWTYTTVVASADAMPRVRPASGETRAAAWVPLDRVDDLRLFKPFAASWPRLRQIMSRLILVVDAANVVGARADGWWRDRIGAARRLRDELARLAAAGLTGVPEPSAGSAPLPSYDMSFPDVVLVVEGAARGLADEPSDGVRVVAAPRSGDDAIVELVSAPEPGAAYLVVTADRELRARVAAAGASYTGPRWLLDQLTA